MTGFEFFTLDEFQRQADKAQRARQLARETQIKQVKRGRAAPQRKLLAAFAAAVAAIFIRA